MKLTTATGQIVVEPELHTSDLSISRMLVAFQYNLGNIISEYFYGITSYGLGGYQKSSSPRTSRVMRSAF